MAKKNEEEEVIDLPDYKVEEGFTATPLENKEVAIIEPEKAEIITINIKKEIEMFSSWKQKVISIRRRYKGKTKIAGIDDKAGMEKNREAARVMLKLRQEAEAEKENHNRPLIDTKAWYDNNYGVIIKSIKEVEAEAKAERDRIKVLKDEKEKEEAKALELKIRGRVKRLIDAKAEFDGEYYSIGSEEFGIEQISIGMVQIGPMTDEDFELLMNQVEEKELAIRDAKAQKKIADEKKAKDLKDAQDKLDEQKKQQEENQKKLDDQNKAIKQKILTTRSRELKSLGYQINVQGDAFIHPSGKKISTPVVEDTEDAAWDELVAETEKVIEEEKFLNELKENRHQDLVKMGYTSIIKYETYGYKSDVSTVTTHITQLLDEEWGELLTSLLSNIEKADYEEALQHDRYQMLLPYAAYGQQVKLANLYLINEDDFDKLFKEKKAAYDNKVANDLKLENEKKEKTQRERLAAATDAEKWEHFIKELSKIKVPECSSEKYQELSNLALNWLEAIFALENTK